MKNILLVFIVFFAFFGCTRSTPNSYINTSTPIFIINKPNGKKAYTDFRDEKNLASSTNTNIIKALTQDGYSIAYNEKQADVIIKGNINYLKKQCFNNTHGYVQAGYSRNSRKQNKKEVEMAMHHTFLLDDPNFGFGCSYEGQASLLIRVRVNGKMENYSTNINFQTDENTHSFSYIRELFNNQISKKIIDYLNFK